MFGESKPIEREVGQNSPAAMCGQGACGNDVEVLVGPNMNSQPTWLNLAPAAVNPVPGGYPIPQMVVAQFEPTDDLFMGEHFVPDYQVVDVMIAQFRIGTVDFIQNGYAPASAFSTRNTLFAQKIRGIPFDSKKPVRVTYFNLSLNQAKVITPVVTGTCKPPAKIGI